MKRARELNKQDSDNSMLVKNHHVEPAPNHNSCGGCNSCHQMTGIHSMTGSPIFGGGGDGEQGANLQKPCATNFFQRNLGNSYIQSIAGNLQTSGASSSGNIAPMIQKKCSCGGSCSGCSGEEELQGIQTKLTIGSANDVYEQEADRVAEQVMRMPESSIQPVNHTKEGINVQKLSAYDGGTPVSDQGIELNQSGGRPLTSATLKFMGPRFGADFRHVRLHADQQSHETASQIQARAFTYRNNIWLGKGENENNKNLLAHELTHVLQQKKTDLAYSGQLSVTKTTREPALQRLPFGISLPTGLRFLDSTEETMATSVYSRSLDYSRILLSNAVGGGGRPFTTYVPSPVLGISGGTVINIGPSVYGRPGSNRNLLIHELAHSWQSQHHPNPAQFMVNSIASQAAAALAGGSAYCYIPGKTFGEYGAEQIATQVEYGVAPIVSEVASTSRGATNLWNVASLLFPHWEKRGDPGVRC